MANRHGLPTGTFPKYAISVPYREYLGRYHRFGSLRTRTLRADQRQGGFLAHSCPLAMRLEGVHFPCIVNNTLQSSITFIHLPGLPPFTARHTRHRCGEGSVRRWRGASWILRVCCASSLSGEPLILSGSSVVEASSFARSALCGFPRVECLPSHIQVVAPCCASSAQDSAQLYGSQPQIFSAQYGSRVA